MALQSSGAISISQINTEVSGVNSNSLKTLSEQVGFSSPHSMSEFYGYSDYVPPPTVPFNSYHYGSAYGPDPQNRAQTANVQIGSLYNTPPYPWRGESWSYDQTTDFYGSNDFPEEGSLDTYIVVWGSSPSHYISQETGHPTGKYYNWVEPPYYIGSVDYYTIYDFGVSVLVRPSPGDGSLDQARFLGGYSLY